MEVIVRCGCATMRHAVIAEPCVASRCIARLALEGACARPLPATVAGFVGPVGVDSGPVIPADGPQGRAIFRRYRQ